MAHPRRIVPGETYFVTRRCNQRAFRLRPGPETNRIFMYCLAFAIEKTGVQLHAVCVMSNHHHLVVTDPLGVLPEFLRELHRLTAKAMNASQGRWENLWAAEPCNVVRLVTDVDIQDKIAYVAANPVAAGLVHEPHEWPGLVAWQERIFAVRRPTAYFREGGTCAPELSLRIERPPTRDGRSCSRTEWSEHLARIVATKVTEARRAFRGAGRSVLGRAAVLAASFVERARSYETRFGVIPTFAAKARSVRGFLGRVERDFRRRYRDALAQWCSGVRDAVFPFGTWGMKIVHGAVVEVPAET